MKSGAKMKRTPLENRITEYVDHLHEHFVNPVIIKNGNYMPPMAPGYSIEIKKSSRESYTFPTGKIWKTLNK